MTHAFAEAARNIRIAADSDSGKVGLLVGPAFFARLEGSSFPRFFIFIKYVRIDY
ncbi:hypothetical protein JOC95_000194 [Bacillus tianshenii]|uniref:Uncharacterized protein n=1 Tax=Sutcliffiella tianshenii TaxID=1463404 RepID=A0ABS2NUS6_9BACI|nr:hypothetical protein [Bacillus tianshenii]